MKVGLIEMLEKFSNKFLTYSLLQLWDPQVVEELLFQEEFNLNLT